MTTFYIITSNGNNIGALYHNDERINGVSLCACDDGGIDDGGVIDWKTLPDDGAAIWHFLRNADPGEEFVARLVDFDPDMIIEEEGMGCDDLGPVESLTISDDGKLTDGNHSEYADLSSPAAFRRQVRRWKAAISG